MTVTQPMLGAHVPWGQVQQYLSAVLDLDLIPEIAIKGPELDSLDETLVDEIAATLAAQDIRPRIHAPFFDLNPGALDPVIREATAFRLNQALDFAKRLNAELIVLHPGVDKWRYPNLDHAWLENALGFFPALIEKAGGFGCRLAIENIYEESPATLAQLVTELDSPWFGHCFDAGHWHLFGKRPMAEWLEQLGNKLFHLHLHDNHGLADEHLPVGAGTIDYTPLQQHLRKQSQQPSITMEAHSMEHLLLSLGSVPALLPS